MVQSSPCGASSVFQPNHAFCLHALFLPIFLQLHFYLFDYLLLGIPFFPSSTCLATEIPPSVLSPIPGSPPLAALCPWPGVSRACSRSCSVISFLLGLSRPHPPPDSSQHPALPLSRASVLFSSHICTVSCMFWAGKGDEWIRQRPILRVTQWTHTCCTG